MGAEARCGELLVVSLAFQSQPCPKDVQQVEGRLIACNSVFRKIDILPTKRHIDNPSQQSPTWNNSIEISTETRQKINVDNSYNVSPKQFALPHQKVNFWPVHPLLCQFQVAHIKDETCIALFERALAILPPLVQSVGLHNRTHKHNFHSTPCALIISPINQTDHGITLHDRKRQCIDTTLFFLLIYLIDTKIVLINQYVSFGLLQIERYSSPATSPRNPGPGEDSPS